LVGKGRAAGLRTLLCETQSTNVPAIRFYRKMGFELEGLDLSHYRNTDYPDGEMAVFMKKPLRPRGAERLVSNPAEIRQPRRSSDR
jgi:ribosomal protein S18 acetylase RimI-like enzyme